MKREYEWYKSSDGIRYEANWQILRIVTRMFDPEEEGVTYTERFTKGIYLRRTNERISEIVHRCIAGR